MGQTKTFSQIISEGYTYPTIIPSDLQAVIYDWYQDRHVANDEKFALWFSRILRNDYEQYNQLLRIEPGYAQYDWLVTQYRELQREMEGTLENSSTNSALNTRRVEGNESSSNTIDKTVSRVLNMDEDYDDNSTSTKTETIGENGSNSKTGTETVDHDSTTDRTNSGTSSDSTTTDREIDARHMMKNLPMSTTYAAGTTGPIPTGLDWSSASMQEQTTTDDDTTTTGSGTTSETEHSVLDGQDKTTYNISDTSGKTTTASNSENRSGGHTIDRDTTSTEDVDSAETKTRSSSDVTTDNNSGSTTFGQESTGLTREIYTGRSGQIANIMEQAKRFIASTNAWDWFMTKIDAAFMGVYDI